ncbi:helix-turn-helix transcriptional regulator [Micromonospora sp. 4G57]|uniref:Helix-turn-helix transcriptional regulator n=1 Tax=Micromonospora sicca TaxID=2202420 RepID=A0ABU5J9Y1_9ACTN|nr:MULTISPECIES: helix-turn-helix transcriptional regulator [unclassified Micromonospora]MDZ5441773.1 helix-turn-helix transcriptional regulator [Micromonospora sp. 4G57]MDZ5489375.1 helix-turn-helix transcriptional regulator [Micromonospora sp. 4G53]
MSLLRRVIGGVLRRVRLRQGRTLREVALAAGVSLPYLSEVERGRKEASSEVLAAICRALGINLSDLLEEARDELRRVERRVPATSGTGLARLDRVPVARHDAGPRLRIGFHPDGGVPHLDGASVDRAPRSGGRVPHVGGATFGGHLARIGGADGPLLRVGGGLLAGGSIGHVGSTVGGAGLRVRLIASVPAGRPRPRTSGVLARRRARAGRRRLTAG